MLLTVDLQLHKWITVAPVVALRAVTGAMYLHKEVDVVLLNHLGQNFGTGILNAAVVMNHVNEEFTCGRARLS